MSLFSRTKETPQNAMDEEAYNDSNLAFQGVSPSTQPSQQTPLPNTAPMQLDETDSHLQTRLEDDKTVTYWQGVCLIVSRQIGAGIFSIPAIVNRNAGSVGASFLFWIAAGCVAYTGACNISLSSLINK
jgi:Tryptophan/tyrosine permease family